MTNLNGPNLPDLGKLAQARAPQVQIGLAAIIANLPKNGEPFDGQVMDGETLAKMVRSIVREELDAWSDGWTDSVIHEAVRRATEP